VEALRKSKPFWTVLGESGVFSAVLRVPITFPPDRFQGVQLSAMCVPDIRGTQGTFAYLSENGAHHQNGDASAASDLAGERIAVRRQGDVVTAYLPGPPNPLRPDAEQVRALVRVTRSSRGKIVLRVAGQQILLKEQQFTALRVIRLGGANRSRQADDANFPSEVLFDLPCQADGPFCHARTGGRHLVAVGRAHDGGGLSQRRLRYRRRAAADVF
jgi:hypothetical protein